MKVGRKSWSNYSSDGFTRPREWRVESYQLCSRSVLEKVNVRSYRISRGLRIACFYMMWRFVAVGPGGVQRREEQTGFPPGQELPASFQLHVSVILRVGRGHVFSTKRTPWAYCDTPRNLFACHDRDQEKRYYDTEKSNQMTGATELCFICSIQSVWYNERNQNHSDHRVTHSFLEWMKLDVGLWKEEIAEVYNWDSQFYRLDCHQLMLFLATKLLG